jgi:serine/alanine adding enzyme
LYNIAYQLDPLAWAEIINKSDFASTFQTFGWHRFIKESTDTNSEVFVLSSNNSLKAMMVVMLMSEKGIKKYFSRRGIVFGGPLFTPDIMEKELQYFLEQISRSLRKKVIYLETRNFFDYSSFRQVFEKAGWSYEPYLNFQLNLKGVEKSALLSRFKYNRRREIKQSLTNGASYGLCENEKEISEIYNILSELYKTRVKLPLPSIDYFLGLYKHNLIKVFAVKHDEKIIGGSFCPFLPAKAIYTYYYCGLRDYHKRIFPTHLAVLAAMEYAIDNNIPVIDFMGAGKPDLDYGVRKYKSEFGGTLVEHGRFIKVLNPFLYNLGKLGLKILSKIK